MHVISPTTRLPVGSTGIPSVFNLMVDSSLPTNAGHEVPWSTQPQTLRDVISFSRVLKSPAFFHVDEDELAAWQRQFPTSQTHPDASRSPATPQMPVILAQ